MSAAAAPPPARLALLGAGSIASRYISALRQSAGFQPVAIVSENSVSARALADESLHALSLDDVLADATINYVLNLTPPLMHAPITEQCLQAGKHVYSEKPLATNLADADRLIGLAARTGLLLACAPATHLWPPLQIVRRLIEDGRVGDCVSALGTVIYPGPELFHPNPAHLFGPGAGPLFDMGVYHVNALTRLLGPVVAVTGMASTSNGERTVRVGPRAGERFPATAPTTVHAQLRHQSGAISTLLLSFDGYGTRAPGLEIHGTKGALCVRLPHNPTGEVLFSETFAQWAPLPGAAWNERDWAVGPVSAWTDFHGGLPLKVCPAEARHALDIMLAVEQACMTGAHVSLAPAKEAANMGPHHRDEVRAVHYAP